MSDTPAIDLVETLPPTWRLALAYAPAQVRQRWLTFMALDMRLAGVVRPVQMGERDPIMAQLRLAWWRDRLKEPSAQWPKGEPLLAALADWQDGHGVLVALVDGWEAMLAEAPLDMGAMGQLADGRVTACVAIASGDAVERMARGWALGEMLDQPAHPDETAALQAAAQAHDWRRGGLPRAMRPLAVLHGLAARHVKGKKTDTIGALIASMRLGLFGY